MTKGVRLTDRLEAKVRQGHAECMHSAGAGGMTSHVGLTSVVWFRVPSCGARDPHFGCTRSFWIKRILPNVENAYKPQIASCLVKTHRLARRGVRLINFESAKEYFDGFLENHQTQQQENQQ